MYLKIGRNNGLSEQWVVGIMGRQNDGLLEKWDVTIFNHVIFFDFIFFMIQFIRSVGNLIIINFGGPRNRVYMVYLIL